MKLLTTVILSSALALSGMAAAAGTSNPTVAKKTVSYVCQQGKKVKVTYGFNKEGGYVLSTGAMDSKSYRKQPIMITAPDNQIVFKDCSPR